MTNDADLSIEEILRRAEESMASYNTEMEAILTNPKKVREAVLEDSSDELLLDTIYERSDELDSGLEEEAKQGKQLRILILNNSSVAMELLEKVAETGTLCDKLQVVSNPKATLGILNKVLDSTDKITNGKDCTEILTAILNHPNASEVTKANANSKLGIAQ